MSEPAENTTRQIQVLGAKSVNRRRRTRKVRSEEEGDVEEESHLPQQPIIISKSQETIPIVGTIPAPISLSGGATPVVNTEQPKSSQVQPTIKTKVVLKPKEKQVPKVLLKKKEIVPGPEVVTKSVVEAKDGTELSKSKTRKVVLNSFHKRINKTRHALIHVKGLSLEHIRAVLIDKKLIKPNSKAPESILRQIYSDSLIVAKKTL